MGGGETEAHQPQRTRGTGEGKEGEGGGIGGEQYHRLIRINCDNRSHLHGVRSGQKPSRKAVGSNK